MFYFITHFFLSMYFESSSALPCLLIKNIVDHNIPFRNDFFCFFVFSFIYVEIPLDEEIKTNRWNVRRMNSS